MDLPELIGIRNSLLRKICMDKFGTMHPASYGDGRKCRDWIATAYDMCFKLFNKIDRPSSMQQWVMNKLSIFPFFQSSSKESESQDDSFINAGNCQKMFAEIVDDYLNMLTTCNFRISSHDTKLRLILYFVTLIIGIAVCSIIYCFYQQTQRLSTAAPSSTPSSFFSQVRQYFGSSITGSGPKLNSDSIPPGGDLAKENLYKIRVNRDSRLFRLIKEKIKNDASRPQTGTQTNYDDKRVVPLSTDYEQYFTVEPQNEHFAEPREERYYQVKMISAQIQVQSVPKEFHTPARMKKARSIYSLGNYSQYRGSHTRSEESVATTCSQNKKTPPKTAPTIMQPRMVFGKNKTKMDTANQSPRKCLKSKIVP